MNIVNQIVDRLHVSASTRGVLRAMRDGMAPNMRCAPELRTNRHLVYRAGLQRHYMNQREFCYVESGGEKLQWPS